MASYGWSAKVVSNQGNQTMPENLKGELAKLTHLPQRQDGSTDQLRDLCAFANKLGLYDAAVLAPLEF